MRNRLLMIVAAGALVTSCASTSASSPTTAPVTLPPTTAESTSTVAAAPAAANTIAPTDPSSSIVVDPLVAKASVGRTGEGCTDKGRSAVVDRKIQRAWLCSDGLVTAVFPITTANDQPDPGHYKVYAKDLKAYSTAGGHYSTMTHFVAFTRGKYTGARVAFHSLPKYRNGDWVEQPSAVGDLASRGDSAGCIRVLYDDSVLIWNTLKMGDAVTVIS